jgi:hypothetical protein
MKYYVFPFCVPFLSLMNRNSVVNVGVVSTVLLAGSEASALYA